MCSHVAVCVHCVFTVLVIPAVLFQNQWRKKIKVLTVVYVESGHCVLHIIGTGRHRNSNACAERLQSN